MKKCITLISSVLLSTILMTPAFAAVEVRDAMKEMGKNYRLVMTDTDTVSMKKDLTSLRAAAVLARTGIPGRMKDQPADSADRKAFVEGLTRLIAQIDIASKLADEGKLTESKTEAAKLKELMKEYHTKFGV